MRIVVIGGHGLIGSRVVEKLTERGVTAVAASRRTGVNSFTADGLADVLDGADVIVDVSNSSYFDEAGALEFFYASTLNLLTYGAAAGVKNHVALSVVGTDRLAATERGYFFAKNEQERLIRDSGSSFSIVHSTQFYEFVRSIADAATVEKRVLLSEAQVRPIAADDVATALADAATAEPTNRTTEIAGPDQYRLSEFVRQDLAYRGDPRDIITDPLARYFGSSLTETELLPAPEARLFSTRYADWLHHQPVTV
ncbi:SDR family oxidoreductase [Subtercola endophyticus]|uniref:SDR family oxidoreductase n=1 Tax=Subtercola endophyticus TaxID=2895559 RepID=UPI001E56435D|nr:NAD-dependent epimerase/dehydratase family protein [Subtercola endophyticus]UFS59439.1 NAD-dependent epimerase/dehydratase family protein [Subtercola endophyticus]